MTTTRQKVAAEAREFGLKYGTDSRAFFRWLVSGAREVNDGLQVSTVTLDDDGNPAETWTGNPIHIAIEAERLAAEQKHRQDEAA